MPLSSSYDSDEEGASLSSLRPVLLAFASSDSHRDEDESCQRGLLTEDDDDDDDRAENSAGVMEKRNGKETPLRSLTGVDPNDNRKEPAGAPPPEENENGVALADRAKDGAIVQQRQQQLAVESDTTNKTDLNKEIPTASRESSSCLEKASSTARKSAKGRAAMDQSSNLDSHPTADREQKFSVLQQDRAEKSSPNKDNDHPTSAASTTTTNPTTTTATTSNTRRRRPLSTPGAIPVAGIGRSSSVGSTSLNTVVVSGADEEDAQGATSPPPPQTIISEAVLVEEEEEEEENVQHDHPSAIAVLSVFDEEDDKRRWQRQVCATVVVVVVLAAGLALGLRLGLDDNGGDNSSPLDPVQPPSNYSRASRLDLFRRAAETVDLWNYLRQLNDIGTQHNGSFTILAPTDESFDRHRGDYFHGGRDYTQHLRQLLRNHIFPGKWFLEDFAENQTITMLSGESFHVGSLLQPPADNVTFEPVLLGSGLVVEPDLVPREPGFVVHGFDGLLDISFLSSTLLDTALQNNLTGVVDLLELSGYASLLVDSEGLGHTAFFPSNEAIDAIPAEVWEALRSNRSILNDFILGLTVTPTLYYREFFVNGTVLISTSGSGLAIHVYEDGRSTVSMRNRTANIIQTDILTYDGVVHVIDNVLYPFDLSDL